MASDKPTYRFLEEAEADFLEGLRFYAERDRAVARRFQHAGPEIAAPRLESSMSLSNCVTSAAVNCAEAVTPCRSWETEPSRVTTNCSWQGPLVGGHGPHSALHVYVTTRGVPPSLPPWPVEGGLPSDGGCPWDAPQLRAAIPNNARIR